MNRRFLAIAQDPSIIHGLHHFCDEWCDYCPITSRCLGFLCTAAFRKERGRRKGDPTFTSTREAAEFTRELCLIDGSSTEELDTLLRQPARHVGSRDERSARVGRVAVRDRHRDG